VRNEGDPFSIGRPARLEIIKGPKGQLIRAAAIDRENIKVAELVGGTRCRRVDEALPVGRDVRSRAIEARLANDTPPLEKSTRLRKRTPDIPRTQWDISVRNQQHFLAVGKPGWLDVHIPRTKIESFLSIAVVLSQSHLAACPLTIFDRSHVNIEISAGAGRDV